MTCNDVESNYRIGKRFKSRTSKNIDKTLKYNMLQTRVSKLTHR